MPASERVARAAINSKEKAMLAKSPKRAALYVRVSTDKQTVQNQIEALTAIAKGCGWTIVETYSDVGISGAKERRDRPGLDRMLNDAHRGKFDVVLAWAMVRVGRSFNRSAQHDPNARSLPRRSIPRPAE